MSCMPLVSVIVPVYKVEAYLHRCVDSILNQSYSDLELILVDDGSPDRCGEICDAYAAQDNRVHVIHQENGGLSAARNAGMDWMMAHSDAQWLTFVDSDDWIHRDYLKTLMGMIQRDKTKLAMCLLERTDVQKNDAILEMPRCTVLRAKEDYSQYPNTTACCKGCGFQWENCMKMLLLPTILGWRLTEFLIVRKHCTITIAIPEVSAGLNGHHAGWTRLRPTSADWNTGSR